MKQTSNARRGNTVRAVGMAWRPVLAAAAALFAVFGFMAPASADGDAYSTDPDRRGAGVNFTSHDEIFRFYDRDIDGWSAVGKIQVWAGDDWVSYPDVWNTKGGNTSVSKDYVIREESPLPGVSRQ